MTPVSLHTLANEIDLLFADYSNIEDAFFCLSAVSGYKNVHDAPQSVQDAESDITYLQSTLNIIEKLFGAEKHTFNLQNPKDILSLHAITIPLETNLNDLHAVLQTWPNPPTVQATELFDTMHSRAVRDLGKRIREAQLKFAVWLSESSTLPSSLDAGLEAVSETTSNEHVEYVELENANETTWTKLNELLKTMPATLRLSHLVKKLDELIVVTSKSQLPRLLGFNDDVKQIQEVVKMLDQRLLVENHFATAVRDEIHRIVDIEIKLLLHELKVLPPHSQKNGPVEPSESNEHPYAESPIHHFFKDHQVIFGMLLVFLAGVRETQGKEEHEEKVVVRDEENEEVEILRDELYENAVAAVLERIAVHSGAANSWFEVQRRARR